MIEIAAIVLKDRIEPVFNHAAPYASVRKHEIVLAEHLLMRLMEEGRPCARLIDGMCGGAASDKIRRATEHYLDTLQLDRRAPFTVDMRGGNLWQHKPREPLGAEPSLILDLIERGVDRHETQFKNVRGEVAIMMSLLDHRNTEAARILTRNRVTQGRIINACAPPQYGAGGPV